MLFNNQLQSIKFSNYGHLSVGHILYSLDRQKVVMDEITLMFGTSPLRINRSQLIFWIRHQTIQKKIDQPTNGMLHLCHRPVCFFTLLRVPTHQLGPNQLSIHNSSSDQLRRNFLDYLCYCQATASAIDCQQVAGSSAACT